MLFNLLKMFKFTVLFFVIFFLTLVFGGIEMLTFGEIDFFSKVFVPWFNRQWSTAGLGERILKVLFKIFFILVIGYFLWLGTWLWVFVYFVLYLAYMMGLYMRNVSNPGGDRGGDEFQARYPIRLHPGRVAPGVRTRPPRPETPPPPHPGDEGDLTLEDGDGGHTRAMADQEIFRPAD